MAARYKVVFFFRNDSQGWSEALYWSSGTLGEDTLLADILYYRTVRRRLLGTDSHLFAFRYTDLTSTIDPTTGARITSHPSTLDHLTAAGATAGTGPGVSGAPWLAFLTNLYTSGSVYRRSYLLRGLPAVWNLWNSTTPVTPVIPPLMATALDAWAVAIAGPYVGAPPLRQTTRWCLQGRSKDPNLAPRWDIFDVSTVSADDHHFTVRIPSTQTFVTGDIVHVSKVRACTARGINGDAVVIGVAPSLLPFMQDLTLSKVQCCEGQILYKGGGKLYKVLKNEYAPINQVICGRTVNRKSGRPFAGTRGRQGARCCG